MMKRLACIPLMFLLGCHDNQAVTSPSKENSAVDSTDKDKWPFADPKNVAVITLKSIVKGGKPILHVAHDADDGMWQFLDGTTVSEENASVVSLEEITRIDPTVMELADLPLGWYAYRSAPSDPWRRGERRR